MRMPLDTNRNFWWTHLPVPFLVVYFFLRARNISLTWDESYSYFEFVRNTDWFPHSFNYMSANDHLLNTWLMKYTVGIFGSSELALRLPNVIAGTIFLFSLRNFLRKLLRDELTILAAFLLIATNPYLIDFFTIARGYGIALACMMIALNHSINFIRSNEWRSLHKAQLWFVLATLAVISFLYVFIGAMIFLFFFVLVRTPRTVLWKSVFRFVLIPFLFAIPFLPYLIKLQHANAFFLGKEVSNPLLLFSSLSDATVYNTATSHIILSIAGKIFLLVSIIALVILISGKQKREPIIFSFLTVTLFGAVLIPVMLHYVAGSNLISGRAAIFCLPLFLLLLIHMCSTKTWQRIILFAITAAGITNGICTMNTRSYFDWSEQADIKTAMQVLRDQKAKVVEPFYANVISTDLPYDLPINYYRMRFGMTEFGHVERDEFIRTCGYYYLPIADTVFYKMAHIIRYFNETKTALFTLMDPKPPSYTVAAENWYDFEKLSGFDELKEDTMFFGDKGTWCEYPEHEFTMTLHLNIPDSLRSADLVATLSARIMSESKNTSALLVFNANTGSTDSWEAMHVSELPEKAGEWSLTGWTRTIPKGTKQLKVYIWNRNSVPVYMDNVSIRVLKAGKT